MQFPESGTATATSHKLHQHIGDLHISSATRKCRHPQITPMHTRHSHYRSHSRPCALPILHRHCRGLPYRMDVHAKTASCPARRFWDICLPRAPIIANVNPDTRRPLLPGGYAGHASGSGFSVCVVHAFCTAHAGYVARTYS